MGVGGAWVARGRRMVGGPVRLGGFLFMKIVCRVLSCKATLQPGARPLAIGDLRELDFVHVFFARPDVTLARRRPLRQQQQPRTWCASRARARTTHATEWQCVQGAAAGEQSSSP